jgi:hypothetical protein
MGSDFNGPQSLSLSLFQCLEEEGSLKSEQARKTAAAHLDYQDIAFQDTAKASQSQVFWQEFLHHHQP